MKKLISACFLLLVMSSLMAQQTPSAIAKPELWQKSSAQRTTGFVLLGAGAIVGTIGMAVGASNVWVDIFSGKERTKGTGAMKAGVSMMAASIPFFILAGKNKRRSVSVSGLPMQLLPNGRQWAIHRAPHVQFSFTQNLL
jgi:hypothetical protein